MRDRDANGPATGLPEAGSRPIRDVPGPQTYSTQLLAGSPATEVISVLLKGLSERGINTLEGRITLLVVLACILIAGLFGYKLTASDASNYLELGLLLVGVVGPLIPAYLQAQTFTNSRGKVKSNALWATASAGNPAVRNDNLTSRMGQPGLPLDDAAILDGFRLYSERMAQIEARLKSVETLAFMSEVRVKVENDTQAQATGLEPSPGAPGNGGADRVDERG